MNHAEERALKPGSRDNWLHRWAGLCQVLENILPPWCSGPQTPAVGPGRWDSGQLPGVGVGGKEALLTLVFSPGQCWCRCLLLAVRYLQY